MLIPLGREMAQGKQIPGGMETSGTPKTPSVQTLTRWMMDGVAEATDGCQVEPDGECPHGCPSWLIKLGYI